MGKVSRIGDVAAQAGVSMMTVSRYVNKSGYVSEEAGERIQQAITSLKYLPNQLARSLQTRSSGNIAVVLGHMSSPASAEVLKGIESVLFSNKYNLLVGNTEFSPERERMYIDMLLRKQIDGLLLAPSSEGEEVRTLQERGIPMGFLFREIPSLDVDVVRFDVEYNIFKLVEHLAELGHQRIALLCRKVDLLHGAPYHAGFLCGLKKADLPFDPALVVSTLHTSVESGMAALERLMTLPQPPTALCTTSNLHTGGVLHGCVQRGLRIPEQFMLVSTDTFGELGAVIHPTITRMELPTHELGVCAAKMLLHRIHGAGSPPPQKVLMQGQFVQGESTRPAG